MGDCERWGELADRRLLDEPLDESETRFFEEHTETCSLCRAEAAAWSDLAATEQCPSLDEHGAQALVERALEAVASPVDKKLPLRALEAATPVDENLPLRELEAATPQGKKLPLRSLESARRARSARAAAGVGVALALAAGIALYLRSPSELPGPAVAVIESASGDVQAAGASLSAGAQLGAGSRIDVGAGGRACIAFDGGKIRSCLDQRSSLSLTSAAGAQRKLTLHEGTVVTALDKLPAGSSFSIDALEGEAVVTGTIFSVTRADGGSRISVRVHEGSVRARTKHGSREVTAGGGLDFDPERAHTVEASVQRHELGLLGLAPTALAQPPAPPSTTTTVVAEPAPSASTSSKDPSAKPPSAAEMLGAARKLRASGNASGAAAAYRSLMSAHPKSAEAHAALLSLAELQLGPLGDAAGALRSYDGYLRSGGGLSQEARYGRIQALGRLGRSSEERAAIEEFVRAYPNSVQARALEARVKKSD